MILKVLEIIGNQLSICTFLIFKIFCRNAIPEPGSDNHAAFMDSKIMEESGKSSTKQSSTTKAPKEEL